MSDTQTDLWHQWFAACKQESAADVALRDAYARLDAEIAARSPTCWLSGKCCHFDSYGHRLYVTGLEIAWVMTRSPLMQVAGTLIERDESQGLSHSSIAPSSKGEGGRLTQFDGCPYQRDKLCGVHAIRPLGCRVFYCDPAAQGWQNDIYERYLAELRALHERLDLPYRYIEWREGLTQALAAGKILP